MEWFEFQPSPLPKMKFEHLTRWLFKVQGFIAWFKHMRKHKIDVPHPFLSPRSQSTKNLGLGRFRILLGVCDAISMLAIWQGASGWCGGHQRLAARQFWEQSSRFGDKCGNGVSRFIYISLSIFIYAIILLLQVYIYIYRNSMMIYIVFMTKLSKLFSSSYGFGAMCRFSGLFQSNNGSSNA